MLLLTDQVWVSPGQWGSVAFFGFLMACLGGLVVNRASRSDVTYAFIASYCALMFGRSLYLGEPMTIPVHRLQSGGLLLFTFFMISDPKTTPDSRAGRVLFAALVAFSAWYVQFRLFRTNGLLWSLAAWSMAVPLIDRVLPGNRYTWTTEPLPQQTVVRVAPSTAGARDRSWGCPPPLVAVSTGDQPRRGLAVARGGGGPHDELKKEHRNENAWIEKTGAGNAAIAGSGGARVDRGLVWAHGVGVLRLLLRQGRHEAL
jgi:hypothetical protein